MFCHFKEKNLEIKRFKIDMVKILQNALQSFKFRKS